MKLHNYQQRAIEFCRTTDKAILSIGCGLGKTASILHYIDEVKPSTVLIVAPKRVAEQVWRQESSKWGLTEIANLRLTRRDSPCIVEGHCERAPCAPRGEFG